MFYKILKIYFLISYIFFANSNAKVIKPFTLNGKQVEKYNDLITPEKIHKGDIIQISKNEKFLVESYLSSGNTTYIFKVKDMSSDTNLSYALRIPKYKGDISFFYSYSQFLSNYIDGEKELKNLTKNSIHAIKSNRGKYVLVDLLGEHFTLKEYLDDAKFNNDPQVMDAFKKFVKETISIAHIGDMHLSQIVYEKSQKKWIIIDWGKSVMTRSSIGGESYFLVMALSRRIAQKDNSRYTNDLISKIRSMITSQNKLAKEFEIHWIQTNMVGLNKNLDDQRYIALLESIPNAQTYAFYEKIEKDLLKNLESLNMKLDSINKNQFLILENFLNSNIGQMYKLKSKISLIIRPTITCKSLFKMIFKD